MTKGNNFQLLTKSDLLFLGISEKNATIESIYDAWTKASLQFRADALCKEAAIHKNYHESYFQLLNIGHKLRHLYLEQAS